MCAEMGDLFMAGEGVKNAPSPTILCEVPCCHGRRIGQDRPGRLKLGSLVLPTALCKTHPRAPKSEAYFGCSGAHKLSMYVHVYVGICMYKNVYVGICMYMKVYIGTCRYM